MAEETIGGLRVQLSLDAQQAVAEMAAATRQLRANAEQLKSGFSGLQIAVEGMFGGLLRFKALLAGLAAGGVAVGIKATLDMASALQNTADRTGIGVEALQAYQFAAMNAGVASDDFTASLLKFTKNVGDARNGTGELVAGLKKTDIAFLETIRQAPTMEAALQAAFDKLAGIGDESKRAALAVELFGKGGTKLTNIVKDGSINIGELAKKLRETGHSLDAELVSAAEKAGNQLRVLGSHIETLGARSILGFLPLIKMAIGYMEDFVTGWGLISQKAREALFPTQEQEFKRVSEAISGITKQLVDLAAQREQITTNLGKGIPESLGGARLESIDRETAALQTQLQELTKSRDALAGETNAKRASIAATQAAAASRREEVISLQDLADAERGREEMEKNTERLMRKRAEIWKETLTPLEKYTETIKELSDAFEGGAMMYETFARGIKKANDQFTADANKVGEAAREVGSAFTSAFEDAVVEGGNLRSMLQAIYKDLLRLFIRRAITNPFLDYLGASAGASGGAAPPPAQPVSFGGPQMAHGGPLGAGQMALVGEKGPELFMPRTAGTVIPNDALGGMTVVINAPNADGATVAQLHAWGRQWQRETVARAVAAGSDFRRRGGRG